MRCVWPWWLRTVAAVAVVVLLYWPYAGWHWHVRTATGRGLFSLSPSGSVVRHESTLNLATHFAEARLRLWLPWPILGGDTLGWRLTFCLVTIMPAALIGIIVYAALTRLSRIKTEEPLVTRCRKCQYILHGLSAPRCPECGEPI